MSRPTAGSVLRHLLGLAGLAFGSAGCDPFLRYSVPGARALEGSGDWYVVEAGHGVETRFSASLFTNRGKTEVQVINRSAPAVEFRPAPTVLTTGDGTRVEVRCELPPAPEVLAKGQTLTIACAFTAEPRWFRYEPRFFTLTVVQPGLSVGGRPLEVAAKMTSGGRPPG